MSYDSRLKKCAHNRVRELEATNAALVEALEAIETACKIPFSQVLVQEMAQNALKLAKGEWLWH